MDLGNRNVAAACGQISIFCAGTNIWQTLRSAPFLGRCDARLAAAFGFRRPNKNRTKPNKPNFCPFSPVKSHFPKPNQNRTKSERNPNQNRTRPGFGFLKNGSLFGVVPFSADKSIQLPVSSS
jgi:hypothetical protein